MNRWIVMPGICLLSLAALAQQPGRGAGAGPRGTGQPATQMPHAQMQHLEQMQQMQARMEAMHQQMEQIQATSDRAQRQRLMREHLQSMQQGMTMMGEMMHGGPPESSAQCADGDTSCRMEQMQSRQEIMNQQMGMMQQMIQQMVEQQMMQGPASEEGDAR